MGGVDLKDQVVTTHLIEHKCMKKWYVKMSDRLLMLHLIVHCTYT